MVPREAIVRLGMLSKENAAVFEVVDVGITSSIGARYRRCGPREATDCLFCLYENVIT